MLSLQTKNKKLKRLIKLRVKNSNINNFSAPAINLSSHVLTEKEQNHLKYGVIYCFISCSWAWNTGFVEPDIKLKDYTYHGLNSLIKNKDIKVLQDDKYSSIIIMDSNKYYEKLETMVNENLKRYL